MVQIAQAASILRVFSAAMLHAVLGLQSDLGGFAEALMRDERISGLELSHLAPLRNVTAQGNSTSSCFNATAWYDAFKKLKPWKKYSQGNQDSVLHSLFSSIGVTNKFYCEFGFNQWGWFDHETGPNTQLLHEGGWQGLLMDGSHFNPFDNLHMEFIRPDNIVELFQKYAVPHEADYVSIDIDSCDLWVFLNLTKYYRPRVVTVEYNAAYSFEDSKTNVCVNAAGQRYSWNKDNMYGASLAALHKAAHKRDYVVVYVEPHLDVFLVRKDLMCNGDRKSVV